eukprot:gb/GECH01008921.1/.p1 GENE.gb/GECH01008921.1/~~gb/GECH01008921.1/.p1  ORF type:complete len:105 (+),score=22.79 gb/GECH01008921.1/:1-315(+)
MVPSPSDTTTTIRDVPASTNRSTTCAVPAGATISGTRDRAVTLSPLSGSHMAMSPRWDTAATLWSLLTTTRRTSSSRLYAIYRMKWEEKKKYDTVSPNGNAFKK